MSTAVTWGSLVPTKTINTETARRFSAWLAYWVDKHKYTQLQAAVLLGMAPSHFNQILSGKSAASVSHMEKVASSLNRDLADMLIEGRQLLSGKNIPEKDNAPETDNEILSGLSSDSKQTLIKTTEILKAGGEDAKLLKQFIKRL